MRGLWAGSAVRWLSVGVAFGAGTPLCAQPPLIDCTPAGVIAPGGEFAVVMPSAVARLSGERWAILDGVNDRVVVTDDAGEGLFTIGESVLDAPLGMALGPDGHLWIADSGNHRVVEMSLGGDLISELALPSEGTDHTSDPVDLAFSEMGTELFIVDNHNHRVLVHDQRTGEWSPLWERLPMGLGSLRYPFSVDVGGVEDRCAVVDVYNNRVLIHEPDYDFTFQVGEWGVDVGELYRPKGVAIGPNDQIFISDSVLGVVQVFGVAGEPVGVLANGDAVRHFTTPTRLAFDEHGRLAVVEMRADRVSLWEVNP